VKVGVVKLTVVRMVCWKDVTIKDELPRFDLFIADRSGDCHNQPSFSRRLQLVGGVVAREVENRHGRASNLLSRQQGGA
jgi:hypothetical protein